MRGPLQPDEVIAPESTLSVQMRKLAVDTAMVLPNLIKLLARLIRDPRVPRRSKLVIGAAMGYVVSPIDLIPEFVPVIGFADDILLMAAAVNHLIQVAGEDVVLEHWDGSRDLLDLIESILDVATDFVPARIRSLLRRLAGS